MNMRDMSDDRHTADGVEITPGLWVWSNDLESVMVTHAQFDNPDRLYREADPTATVYSRVWYDTTGPILNGTRMVTVFNGLKASDFKGLRYSEANKR